MCPVPPKAGGQGKGVRQLTDKGFEFGNFVNTPKKMYPRRGTDRAWSLVSTIGRLFGLVAGGDCLGNCEAVSFASAGIVSLGVGCQDCI
jgi:hypothetical protein